MRAVIRPLAALLVVVFTGLAPANARAQGAAPDTRWASLRADKVNGRAGPSLRHPILWVYVRRGLPMEVLAETKDWRFVRDPDGAEVWVHKRLLGTRRTAMAAGANDGPARLRAAPRKDAALIGFVGHGRILDVERCAIDWCEVRAGDLSGWALADDLIGDVSDVAP